MSQAEQSVIGACLLDPSAFWRVSDRLTEQDFADPRHALLWRAIAGQLQAGAAADAVTLADWLEAKGLDRDVGGTRYVLELANTTPSAANVESYAAIVAEHAALRRVALAGAHIASAAKRRDTTAADVVDEARKLLDGALPLDARAVVSAKAAVAESFEELKKRFYATDARSGLVTGIDALDDATDGLQPERLYVLAARPSMGKSMVAGFIAGNAGMAGKRVAIFSAEMSAREWSDRWISMAGRVPQSGVTHPKSLGDDGWAKITSAMTAVQSWPVFLDASPVHSIATITARSMQMHTVAPLSLIVIDHLGLLDLLQRKGETRATAIGDATKALKALAKRLGVPVLLLCQLNREGDGHEPTLKDLRDSGRIEEDADGVFFLHRPGYYDPKRDAGYTKFIIGKLRAGKRETLEIYCDMEFMSVTACTREHSAFGVEPEKETRQRGFGSQRYRNAAGGQ